MNSKTVVVNVKPQVMRGSSSLDFTLPDGTVLKIELTENSKVDLVKRIWLANTNEISLAAQLVTKS